MAQGDYKWNSDSREERQSDFSQSTFSATTAEAVAHAGARRAGRRGGRTALVAGIVLLLAVLGAAWLYLGVS